MKCEKWFYGKARLLSMWGLWLCIALPCHSQEQKHLDDEAFLHQTLSRISALGPELRDFYRPQEIKGYLQIARQSLISHLDYADDVLKRLQQMTDEEESRQAVLKEQLEVVALQTKEQTGYSVLSEDAIELLIRNCLVELQQLEWQSIGLATEVEAVDSSKQLQGELLRLQAREVALAAVEQKLESARQDLQVISKSVNAGLNPTDKLREAERNVEAIESELREKRLTMEAIKMDIDVKFKDQSSAAASKLKAVEHKKSQIRKQIESLEMQKQWSQKASLILQKKELYEERIRDLERMRLKYTIKKLEYGSLEGMVKAALEKDKAEENKKPK